ncbi:MAG TPA: cytochrome P450 [Streptosporangiaceae bacterium]|nr:cytochrome P450 [Streptosporangiaceae bacterium]
MADTADVATLATRMPPRFDPLSPDVLDDPYPAYARLRAAGPVSRAGPGIWALNRHADIAAALRDERLGHRFSDEFRRPFTTEGGPASALLQGIVSSLQPPEHTRVRQLLSKSFTPSVVRGLRGSIGATADRLLAAALERGTFDAVADLSLPLQISVGCELLGIPDSHRDEIWPRATALGRAFIPFVPAGPDETADDVAVTWLREFVTDMVARRRRHPGDDLLSRMLYVERGGDRLSDSELVDNAIFLFFAGFETSMYLLCLAATLLATHPGEFARLRADRSLVPAAVEEFLRYDPPIQWMARIALAPLTVGDTTVRPGRVVLLLLGSANRDEDVFANPGKLDIGRQPNQHLGFGGGIHHCLGVNLARTQGAVVLGRLLGQCSDLRPAGQPVRRPHPNLRGYESVPVTLVPA